MQINEIICILLRNLNCNMFYIHKPDGIELDEYITFNATLKDEWFSNNFYESNTFVITINILTKNISNISDLVNQVKNIIDNDKNCYGFSCRGSSFIKDTNEFQTVCSFNLLYFD